MRRESRLLLHQKPGRAGSYLMHLSMSRDRGYVFYNDDFCLPTNFVYYVLIFSRSFIYLNVVR